jgi:nucleotide-binding universal stress UspA family protein
VYKRILLASDGTRESLVALREGALIAKAVRARVWLMIIEPETASLRVADGIYPAPRDPGEASALLGRGLQRLARLGVAAEGEVVFGEPAPLITARARAFKADLVVVGHRRRSFLERWWSGGTGAYLIDGVTCSVLVARDVVSDAEFEAHLAADGAA